MALIVSTNIGSLFQGGLILIVI